MSDNTKWYHKLFLQLGLPFLGFVLFVLFSYLTLTIIAYNKSVNEAKRIPIKESERLSTELSNMLLNSKSDLMLASLNADASFETSSFLQDIVTLNQSLLELTFYDISGVETVRFTKSTIGGVTETVANSAEEQFFKQAIALGGDYLGDQFTSSSGMPFVYWSTPIRDPAGTITGVVRATIDLTTFWDSLSRATVGKAYLIDERGVVIISSNLRVSNDQIKANNLIANAFIDKNKGTFEFKDASNTTVVSSWSQIPLTKWGVVVEVVKKDLFREVYVFQAFSLLTILITLIVVLLEISQINRKVFRPISILKEAAIRLGDEQTENIINVNANNEFDAVASTFNQMSEKIRNSYQELEQKVQERTLELKKSKEELEAKFKEIEALNKFMIGREIKMTELKEQIIYLTNKINSYQSKSE